ncbi:RNA polymerase sigma factor SigJ [Paucibacter soli]|uniref:RNA polymerase sigma factor SigJ n=1 Tax=Paucibacter soli TaxID=3133433 RepID=UPI0030B30A12
MGVGLDLSPAARALRFDREHARSLRALAYRMLGSRAEAEDMVQEAWLRWAEVDEGQVLHAGAFLSRLLTHLCLDRLKSAAARRELYVGTWLPEPLVDGEAEAWSPGPEARSEWAQDVSMAFMLTLERLTPLERAAFLLHDVFELDFDEVAARLQRSPAACRQLASRARGHVKAGYARVEVQQEERQRLLAAFAGALMQGDVEALAQVLAEDAVLLSDGGGRVHAIPHALRGAARIAKALVGFGKGLELSQFQVRAAEVNGLPGYLVFQADGTPLQAVALAPAAEPGKLGAVYIVRNPEKLKSLRAANLSDPGPPH